MNAKAGVEATERERGDLMIRSISGKQHALAKLLDGDDSVGSQHFAGAIKCRGSMSKRCEFRTTRRRSSVQTGSWKEAHVDTRNQ